MAEVYFMRHGVAVDRDDGTPASDALRPLTDEGEQKTRTIAQRLHQTGLRFDRILTSPLTRARQTADLVLGEGLAETQEIFAPLAPDGDLQQWLDWWDEWPHDSATRVLLVGHQPDLSHWAETLIWGKALGKLQLKKAGLIGLQVPNRGSPLGQSLLFWLTPPRFLIP